MSFLLSIWSIILAIILFCWSLIKLWVHLFAVSFTHLETLWIIIPIWLSWFFSEFFQEKEGTDFGNAITNGAIPVWVGIDWVRQLTGTMMATRQSFNALIFFKFFICAVLIIYGMVIIIFGIKGREWVKYVGRIREVTYFLVVLTPLIYGLVNPTYKFWIVVFLFFPVFYYLVEFFDKKTPTPNVIRRDRKDGRGPTTRPPMNIQRAYPQNFNPSRNRNSPPPRYIPRY